MNATPSWETSAERVRAALAGELDLRELSAEEGVKFNAAIDAALQESLEQANYSELLAERGITTVALDESGRLVEYRPKGH